MDTFEAEAAIDLNAIAAELAQIELAEVATKNIILGFCAELGIAPPFAVDSSH